MWAKIIGPILSSLTGINWKALGQSFIKFWYLWIIALLISSNTFTGWHLYDTQLSLQKEQAAHTRDIQEFKNTQELANTKAQLIKSNLEKEAQVNAEKADANYLDLLTKYHASLLRYKAYQSGASGPGDNSNQAAQGSNGPSTSTELPDQITITGEDAQICAVNTARLQAVHDWAVNLPK